MAKKFTVARVKDHWSRGGHTGYGVANDIMIAGDKVLVAVVSPLYQDSTDAYDEAEWYEANYSERLLNARLMEFL